MSEEKFSKCEEGEKCLSVKFRVFGKKEVERKVLEEKKKVLGRNFAKFVFTGWAFYVNFAS